MHLPHPSRRATLLSWRPCTRSDSGAVWTGARWSCPPFGAGTVLVAAAGVAIAEAVRVRRQWRPWWEQPTRHTRPHTDPVTLFAGDEHGITVGGLR